MLTFDARRDCRALPILLKSTLAKFDAISAGEALVIISIGAALINFAAWENEVFVGSLGPKAIADAWSKVIFPWTKVRAEELSKLASWVGLYKSPIPKP